MWKQIKPVQMRKADPFERDLYVLEELSRPNASLNASRITIWVYQDNDKIRRIVIAGHAEGSTCASVSSIVIESAKTLGSDVRWMIACGAGYFDVDLNADSGPAEGSADLQAFLQRHPGFDVSDFPGAEGLFLSDTQRILREMLTALHDRAKETGLIDVLEKPWSELTAFRDSFQQHRTAKKPLIVLPDGSQNVADYVPIMTDSGSELVFHLEGWDFDCPQFQNIADIHLRSVQRELLQDASRRRRTYREWLRRWITDWYARLPWLGQRELSFVAIEVPAEIKEPPEQLLRDQPVSCQEFLDNHLTDFIDPGERWCEMLAHEFRHERFGNSPVDLDEQIMPDKVTVYDFERGEAREKSTTHEDRAMSWRERLCYNMPSLISECLRYIRRMNFIIEPYEDLRLWQRAARRAKADDASRRVQRLYVVADVSRRMVMETMIRGWPSYFLQHAKDRELFQDWASKCRPHVWEIMGNQARRAQMQLDILLEDNVVYQVEFDDDLGCNIKPLMLADQSSHAQVHGSKAGASAAVPLWPRHTIREMELPKSIKQHDNCQRATALIDKARRLTEASSWDLDQAAQCLRTAIACHPAEAGKLILQEWCARLGRDTADEFHVARQIVEAQELCVSNRYQEAQSKVRDYLQIEPRPIADAYVIAALCELMEKKPETGPATSSRDLSEEEEDEDDLDLLAQGAISQMLERFAKQGDGWSSAGLLSSLQTRMSQAKKARRQTIDEEHQIKRDLLASLKSCEDTLTTYHDTVQRHQRVEQQLEEITGKPLTDFTPADFTDIRIANPKAGSLLAELRRLVMKLNVLDDIATHEKDWRRGLIQQALDQPESVAREYPALALVAKRFPEELKGVLETKFAKAPKLSKRFIHRYYDLRLVVEKRALLEIVYALAMAAYEVDEQGNDVRTDVCQRLRQIDRDPWLPRPVAEDLKRLIEDAEVGDWDTLMAKQISGTLREWNSTNISRIHELMNDDVVRLNPMKESTATRIQVVHNIERKYCSAMQGMLRAKVELGHSLPGKWRILDRSRQELQQGESIDFDGSKVFVVDQSGSRSELLQAPSMNGEERDYCRQLLCNPKLADRISPVAPTLAEGILASEAEPCPAWTRWRDTMIEIERELTFVMANFSGQACLLPELALNRQEDGDEQLEEAAQRMNELTPRDAPTVDWDWQDLGSWKRLTGDQPLRLRPDATPVD